MAATLVFEAFYGQGIRWDVPTDDTTSAVRKTLPAGRTFLITNDTDQNIFYRTGDVTTDAALHVDPVIKAGFAQVVTKPAADTHMSIIQPAAASGNIYVCPGKGA